MANLNSYRELLVWQKSMNLAEIKKSCVRDANRGAEEIGRMLHGLIGSSLSPFPLPPSPFPLD